MIKCSRWIRIGVHHQQNTQSVIASGKNTLHEVINSHIIHSASAKRTLNKLNENYLRKHNLEKDLEKSSNRRKVQLSGLGLK
ncbi:MAG: hypothetical protein KZQ67_16755 [gamma proteobacterium symbiont of Bathyaustriella thionipta]|nr:hypothetical protein [gamma proteobacterium symbiont of Bathyaustriella thionipta]MCU7958231.1 hypothetical protein [gamma proteobacterium symbiont of Bathyaustriella thionipta]